MKSKTTLILLLLIHIIGVKLAAQVQINAPSSYQPVSIEQGGAPGAYKVDIINNNTGSLNNATFSLALPAGMEYVAGSITGANQLSIANLQNPTFTLNSIPVGNTLQITFNLRINCGYSASTINYSVISGGSTIATGSSAVAGNTPSPAFLFTTVPSPQVLSTPLKTDALRTIKFKNTGVIPVTTVYIESTVTTASQSAYYKVAGANHGTVSTKTNGFRLTLTGTELQSAVTTAVGAANTSFDPGEEITIILTEQMLSCSTGNSIALNIKAGSGDSKGSLCFSDSSTAAISTAVGNPAMSVTRLAGTTYPDFCTNGKVSYTIANTGSGTASALYNLKFPWSMNFSNASLAPIIEPEAIAIKKILLNGNDVTSLVLTRNGTGSSALIPGLPNCWVINLAGLTSANGTLLQNLDGDGKYDDLPAGQSFQLDFEYGFNTSAYLTCSLNSLPLPNTGSNYFCLGSSYIDQCGVRTNRTNYPYGLLTDYTKPTFQVGAQQYNTFTASLDKAALYPGDKIILSTTFSAGLARAIVQPGKTLKTFTIILPDGLDYDASQPIRYMYTAAGAVIPASAITYNAATKTLVISPSVNLAGITASDDLLQIPLVVSGTGTVTNKTIQYSSTFAFPGCGITMPYGCSSQSLNYAVINGGCATVGTTYFDMTRATFGYVPAPSNTNVWYMPTAYVDENTPGINLHGAVSKDKIKTVFKGVVNSTAFTELWARVKYTSNAATNSSNFDKISTNASDLAGTITITKASDGSTVSGNITVADIVFSTDAVNNLQLQQVNLGAKIGSGKQINYVLQVGDQITINWFTKVSRDNLSYTYSQLANLEGDLYTKDVNGVSSDCQAIPVGFSIQRLYLALNNNSSLQAIVGQNSYRIGASVINGQNSIDVTGDHFLNEVRTYGVIRNVKATLPGIWILDTSAGKEPYYTSSLVVGNSGLYKFDPSLLSVTYVGGNTIVTFSNAALGSNGMPLSTSNLPVVSDWIGVNGSTTLAFYMLPVCATAGPIIANVNQVFDLYTTESNGSNTENTSSTFNYGSNNTVYYNYTANSAPTLQNVDGVGSTVNWQVKVTNTSDTAAITAAGGSAALPNNWMSFVSPNNNITVTKLTNVATGIVYPAISYGTGKYWVKLGDIAASATFDVEAHYTACTNDKLQYTYNFGATGYPIDPDQGFNSSISTCTATQSKADLNLFPKDVNLSMTVTSPANPVQFCTNETSGENKIDYTLSVSNTAVGNAENLILEAVFPDGYSARAGTSTLTYNGITKTLKEPVYNSSRGTWEWNISADPNGISFLPWSGAGVNSFVFTYRGETSCGFASGSAVSYNMRSTSGCGKVVEYTAKGNAMQLSMKPPLLNAYYLAPGVVDLKNDGSGALYQIEVTNQGVQPLSPGESIFVTMPKSLDYVTGSVIHISGASNVGEPINNVVVGNNRILNFPLPTGVIDPSNLQQNETAKFSIQLKIIDAKTLNCGLTTDAIKLDAIYSVPGVTCGVSPCDVTVITGSAKSNINVTKTTFTITPTSGIAAYASTTTNNAIIKYTINNTGTIANNTPIIIDFFNDLNGDGLYTAAKPILYSQTINDTTMNIAAGASSAEQTTASFSIPESSICNIAAAIRVANNPQLCVDTVVNVPIKYESQTTAFTVCAGLPVTIGNPSNGAVVSWSPADYLSDANASNPIFKYDGTPLSVPVDFTYTATITHPGGCTNTFTNTVTVDPLPLAVINYPNSAYCNRGTAAVTQTGIIGGTYTGDSGLVINSTTGLIDLEASTIGNHDVTYTFTDGNCENIAKTIITINETTLPDALSNFTAQCTATVAAPTLTDPCAGLITATPNVTFPITSQGTTTITWTFDYGGGFTRTVTQDVIIQDTTPPAVPVLADISVECELASPTAPTTIDNCAGTVIGTTNTIFPITSQGTTIITWTFSDGNGNISTANQNVIIHDVTAPNIPTLVDIISKCPISPTPPTAFDNCAGSVTGTTTTIFPITAKGSTDITWTFNDGNGNTSTAVQKVTILDITATIDGATAVCEDAAMPNVTFTGAGGTAPYTFIYTINGGPEQTVTTTVGNSVSIPVPTDSAGTFAYALVSVRDTDAACENVQADTVVITVNPKPTVITVNPAAVCVGTTVDLTAEEVTTGSTTGLSFTYYSDAAGVNILTNPNSVTESGTYYIKGTTAAGCSDIKPVTVTVNPLPVAAISYINSSYCNRGTAEVTQTGLTGGVYSGDTGLVVNAATGTIDLAASTVGNHEVTYLFNDGNCENTTKAIIEIQQTTLPVALNTVNAECSVSLVAPTISDACTGTITATTSSSFPITTQGSTIVTWIFDYGGGFTRTVDQNVIITDITAPAAPVLADVTAECEAASLTAPTAVDNCAGTVTGTTTAVFPITAQGTTVVTWTFNDGNGNISTADQNVIIRDVTAPAAPVLADITGQCSVTPVTPTTTDNCAGTVTGTTATVFPITAQGTTIVTWTFDDGNGNTSTADQNVIITDVTAPAAPVLADVTAECEVASLTAPIAVDNCAGTVTGTTTTVFPITTQGTTVVTWTFNDGNGNTSTADQNVIITDVTAPAAPVLADVTAECEVASLTAPTAVDNCAGTVTGTTTTVFPITAQGTTVVTWTFDDGNGNTSTADQNVIIRDVTAPAAPVLADITGQCIVTPVTPTTTDNCAGTIAGTTTTVFPITTQGTTVVAWTFNDGNGNTSTADQNVIITDVTAPAAPVLADVTAECEVASLTAPITVDNCAGTVTGTTTTVFPITAQGTTVVTWTFDDGNGNTSTAYQNVIIRDVTAPAAPVLADITGQCSVTPVTPTTTDNCAGTVTGTTTTVFPITAQGTTVVTWTFDDGNGNIATANQNIIITDTTPPVVPVLADVTAECEVASLIAPTALDNCAGTVTGTTTTVFPITAQGTTVVTWTFDEGNGNIATANQNIIITDTTPPVVPVLADVTAECEAASLTVPTAVDNCAGTVTGTTTAVFPITAQGTTVVTWTFNDGNGNTSTADQNVIITDVTAPAAPVLADVTAECEVTSLTVPTAVDNCAGTVTGTTTTVFPITSQGTTVVTWTFNDGNGNTSTADQNVIITDVTAPAAPVLADVTAECEIASLAAPRSVDNCAGTVTGTTTTVFPITAQGTTVVTWTFDDGNGNTSTSDQNVIIRDVTAPAAPVLVDVTAECEVASLTAPTAMDNCAGTVTGTTTTVFPITAQGTTVVTWTFNDGNGNTSTADQNVIITDVTAPALPVLADVTAECEVASLTVPTAVDNCAGTITGTTTTVFPITAQGTTVVTWTFNDGNGNTSTADQNVIIRDVTAPAAPVLADITGQCSVTPVTPTTTDNCAGTVTGTTAAVFPITAQGTTVVTWTFNDGNGNTSAADQNVIITDTTPPVVPVLADVTAECEVASLTVPTAVDNCAGTVTGTTTAVFPITAQGTTVVTWTFNDGNGNTSTADQNVIIRDVTAPAAPVLADVTVECEIASLTAPTAVDNCAGTVTGTTTAVFPITAQGTTVVKWTFNDGNGNTSTADQNVIITDTTPPAVPVLADVTAECEIASLTAPTAVDNCAGTVTGTTTAVFPITAQGTTIVTWTFNDGNGNKNTADQNVIITDVTAPAAPVLADVRAECEVASLTAPTAVDNCAGTVTGTTTAVFPITDEGTTVVTWTFNDGNGNVSTADQNIIIEHVALNGSPSTQCALDGNGYVLTLNVTGQPPYTVTGTGTPGTWSGNSWTSDKILAGVNYDVKIQDAYACNIVTVADVAPVCCVYEVKVPTFPAANIACYSELPTAQTLTEAEYEALGNGDGNIGDTPCGVIEITASNGPDPGCNGNVLRTYTVKEYEDPNNNKVRDTGEDTVMNTTSVTQTFTIERADFVMPEDGASTVDCISAVTAPVVPEVKDNCGNILTALAPVISPMPVCNGIVTYTYSFKDCAEHTHNWVYTYTINNTKGPQGTAPADMFVQCIADIPVANSNAVTNVTGNCNNNVTITITDANNGGSGCAASPYILTRTYTLTDCSGLTSQLVQTIIASDTTAPVFAEALPANIAVECSDSVPTAAVLTASDNCSTATVTYNEVRVNGTCSGNYKLYRTWIASDACGNQTSHTQTVIVTDATAPVFVEPLPQAVVNADCNTIPEPAVLTATDLCGTAVVNYDETKTDGNCTAKYTLDRTWTAIDECGNQTTFTQRINVLCIPNIYNGLSPNGDGRNDTFIIQGIDCFPNNVVRIYNRYGVIVYEKKGYDNVTDPFEGFSDGRATIIRGDKLPTGTYFYTLEFDNDERRVEKTGYLYISN